MKKLQTAIILLFIHCSLFIVLSCSTTSRISADDPLYTGIKEVNIDGKKGTAAEEVALEELEGALSFAPNNSLFGSSRLRYPLPVGLWVYNNMDADSLKGFKKWFYSVFAAQPKTISSVTPDIRVKVAKNVLQNYGYFHADVDYRLITSKRDSLKQKIAYDVKLGEPYTYDSIKYVFKADSLVQGLFDDRYLHEGNQFSVADLQSEKTRLTNILHNNGYYYYRPDYIKYFADSINSPGKVKLLVAEDMNTPARAKRQWKFGKINVFLRDGTTNTQRRGQNLYNDTIHRKRFDLAYQGKRVPIRIPIVMRNFKFWTGMTYSEDRVNRTLAQMARLNTFSSTQFSFTPADTTDSCSVLDVRFDATMDKLLDTELEFNFTQRSNSQLGPDIALTFSKRNAFRNGEKLSLKLRGSYYWQYTNRSEDDANNMDSYEFGADLSLAYPWLVFPYFLKKNFYRPTSSDFTISFTRTNIAKYIRFNQFGLGAEYKFYPSNYITHTFSPFKIEVLDLRKLDEGNDSTSNQSMNRLKLENSDGIIPSMQYTFTYDNSTDTKRAVQTNFKFSIKEGGNVFGTFSALFGKGFSGEGTKILGKKFEQFVNVQMELRNRFRLTPKSCLATRLFAGYGYGYGNSGSSIPISEFYYSGGAYSIRAFPSRGIGPGEFTNALGSDYYLLHGGDMRFEANAEYRFPLFGNLYGAVFLDAGNTWERRTASDSEILKECKEMYPDADEMVLLAYTLLTSRLFSWRDLGKQIALGTGFGLRYDLDFLVVRVDVGIALHAPYKTGKSGYYNIPRFFKDGVRLNIAVGYPF